MTPFGYTGGVGDYTSISQPLTFTPGSGSQQLCADITIIDDNIVESDESFLIVLNTLATDVEHVDFSLGSATAFITNDDSELRITT